MILTCPKCGSEELTVSQLQRFMANTGKHYCHSMKTHDADSAAICLAAYEPLEPTIRELKGTL